MNQNSPKTTSLVTHKKSATPNQKKFFFRVQIERLAELLNLLKVWTAF